MLVFPPCKINLGLNIIEKRPDGFHNIESVFYSVNWRDALEITEVKAPEIEIVNSGLSISGKLEENLIFKTYNLLKEKEKLPHLKVHLHKTIPMGAGLGGGSSDVASFLKAVNLQFNLNLGVKELKEIASKLGSDCAFFVENKATFATQKGEVLENIELDLSQYHILVVYPSINSSTKEAYEGVIPKRPVRSVKEIVLKEPVENWKNVLVNDFETSIFKKYPEIENIKNTLYKNGALYSSMSGSGSAVFGIFKERRMIEFPKNYLCHLQEKKV